MPKKTPAKRLMKKVVEKNTARKATKAPVAKVAKTPTYTEAPLPFLPHHVMHVEFVRRDDVLPDEGPFMHKAFAIVGELGGYTNRFGEYTEPGVLIAIEGKLSRISRNDLLDALFCGAYVNRVVQDMNKIKAVVEGFFAKAGEPVDEANNDGEPGKTRADGLADLRSWVKDNVHVTRGDEANNDGEPDVKTADSETGEDDLNPPAPFTDNSAPFEA